MTISYPSNSLYLVQLTLQYHQYRGDDFDDVGDVYDGDDVALVVSVMVQVEKYHQNELHRHCRYQSVQFRWEVKFPARAFSVTFHPRRPGS